MWDFLTKGGNEVETMDTIQNVAAVAQVPDMFHLLGYLAAFSFVIMLVLVITNNTALWRLFMGVKTLFGEGFNGMQNEIWKVQDTQNRQTERTYEENRASNETHRRVVEMQAQRSIYQLRDMGRAPVGSDGD